VIALDSWTITMIQGVRFLDSGIRFISMSMQEEVRSAVPRTVTPGSRRSSHSHERSRREVDEVVVPTNGHAGN
jgi:hypothetical protein